MNETSVSEFIHTNEDGDEDEDQDQDETSFGGSGGQVSNSTGNVFHSGNHSADRVSNQPQSAALSPGSRRSWSDDCVDACASGGTDKRALSFHWGSLEGGDFAQAINAAYAEVTHWRRNVFNVPSGQEGKAFVAELARLFRAYADASALQSVAIKAAMVMPHLLLQRSSPAGKAKDNSSALGRRLLAWNQGDIDALVREGRVLQRHLVSGAGTKDADEQLASNYSRLMLSGKTRAAQRLLSTSERGGVLAPGERVDPSFPDSETVLDVLKKKHPVAAPVKPEALVSEEEQGPSFHPILFMNITGDSIRRAALRCGGSAGPSGLDASAWQRICTSFKSASTDLCSAVALFARRICTEEVSFEGLEAFTACRLVALEKCPGVRPIGVAEVCRRIVGKAILHVVRTDVQQVAGCIQLCAGQQGGCEAAIHATRMMFEDDSCEGVLLIDASNAFNRLNRRVALSNVKTVCPSLATVLTNTYRGHAALFVGSEKIYSQEGITQGDPLSLVFYALATLPMIKACKVEGLNGEVWYADDATGGGRITKLRHWWDNLVRNGPMYGYYPNGVKTWLVVKPSLCETAFTAFAGTDVQITTQGRRHLRSALGSREFVRSYVTQQVDTWIGEMEKLSKIATCHPHAAYSGFIHGIRGRWLFLARVIPGIGDLLKPLESTLRSRFLPALTGRTEPGDVERELLSLPARYGGLGIISPVEMADSEFEASQHLTSHLVGVLLQQIPNANTVLASYPAQQSKSQIMKKTEQQLKVKAESLREQLPVGSQRAMDLAQEKGASNWLAALPLRVHGFDLSKSSFRDAICLRYGWQLQRTPPSCVCGTAFSTEHALSCPTGGLPTRRHNEIRDYLAHRLSEVCADVSVEPELQPLSGETFQRRSTTRDDAARLDIHTVGFWDRQLGSAFFDVRIFNPFAPSNCNSALSAVYQRHERQKRNTYEERVRTVEHASFTPLVFSTTGGASRLTTAFLKHLASRLAEKHEEQYNITMACLRTQIAFALLRAAILCVRGARSSSGHPRLGQHVAAELVVTQARMSG